MATSEELVDRYLIGMGIFWILAIFVLILEAFLKIVALLPRADRYFRNGWYTFDFLTISFLVVSIAAPALDPSVDYAVLLL